MIPICEHPRREWGRRVGSNGSVQIKEWCPDCGKPLSNARKQRSGDEFLPLIDTELHERYVREQRERYMRLQRAKETDWWRWYNEYLQTPEWHARRTKVLERAGYLCEGCRETAAAEVHHLSYAHAGDEFLFELVALCHSCHERWHAGGADS